MLFNYSMKFDKNDKFDSCLVDNSDIYNDVQFFVCFHYYIFLRKLFTDGLLSFSLFNSYVKNILNCAHKVFGCDFDLFEMMLEKEYFDKFGNL